MKRHFSLVELFVGFVLMVMLLSLLYLAYGLFNSDKVDEEYLNKTNYHYVIREIEIDGVKYIYNINGGIVIKPKE